MRPSRGSFVNKSRSASHFRSNTGRTKSANVGSPTRGGWRL